MNPHTKHPSRWMTWIGVLLGASILGSARVIPNTDPARAGGGPTLIFKPDKPVYAPGEAPAIGVMGLPFTLTFIGMDTDPGPTTFPFGVVNLGFSPEFVYHVGFTNEDGCFHVYCTANCGDPLLGRQLYFQGFQLPAGGPVLLTNAKSAMWADTNGTCAQLNLCPGGGLKPAVLAMTYTGDDCSATSHHQDPSKVFCNGDPEHAAAVHVIARDPAAKYVWFEGDVALGSAFDVDATSAGRTQLQGDTVIELFDTATGALLQTVQFHTSCSQPLVAGDQYGGVRLDGLVLAPKN